VTFWHIVGGNWSEYEFSNLAKKKVSTLLFFHTTIHKLDKLSQSLVWLLKPLWHLYMDITKDDSKSLVSSLVRATTELFLQVENLAVVST
jgi:hypothetical protein